MKLYIKSSKHGCKEILIDAEDYYKIVIYKWHINKNGNTFYVMANIKKSKKWLKIYMHRLLLDNPKNIVDHKNRNGLDNRKNNLRICTIVQNSNNRKLNKNNISGYNGINYINYLNKWRVQIQYNWKRKTIGFYKSLKEAKHAYNKAKNNLK